MQSKRSRLDRYLSSELQIPRKHIKPLLAQNVVEVNGLIVRDADYLVDEFSRIIYKNQILQNKTPRYLMLHKPKGVVSATKDLQHKTVVDLLDQPYKNNLHIVGRLDFNSTGLLLLSNDGRWSRALMNPEYKVEKCYRVRLAQRLSQEMVETFAKGMYFKYENINTKPAKLDIISDYIAEVTLQEGRYHQLKRMFGHFQNKVLAIHRFSIGKIVLDEQLRVGQSRALTATEISL